VVEHIYKCTSVTIAGDCVGAAPYTLGGVVYRFSSTGSVRMPDKAHEGGDFFIRTVPAGAWITVLVARVIYGNGKVQNGIRQSYVYYSS
jgi:hypothetical protein